MIESSATAKARVRRVGVLGDTKAGGNKALFLRTSKDISLFLSDETEDFGLARKALKSESEDCRKFETHQENDRKYDHSCDATGGKL